MARRQAPRHLLYPSIHPRQETSPPAPPVPISITDSRNHLGILFSAAHFCRRLVGPYCVSALLDKTGPEPRGSGSSLSCQQACRKLRKNLSVSVCLTDEGFTWSSEGPLKNYFCRCHTGRMAQKPDPCARDSPRTNGHPRDAMPCRRRRFCRNKVGAILTNPARLAYPFRFCPTTSSVCGSPMFLTVSDRYHPRKSANSMPH